MGNPTNYSIANLGDMVTSEPRMEAYAKALKQAVSPGCTVIDIGAGFGIFSLLACSYGASSVIAIEPADSIELLKPLAEVNGYAERITIVRGLSTAFEPFKKADVIVSDIRGILPLFESHIETIVDARKRLLAPLGKLLPARDILKVALVNDLRSYRSCKEPWISNRYDLDLSPGHKFAVNSFYKVHLSEEDLLSRPTHLATLDYREITSPNLKASGTLVADVVGAANGLLVWFDAEISGDHHFSNAPGKPPLIYGQTFFPFEEQVQLEVGDRIQVELIATAVDGAYVWSWNSAFYRGGSSEAVRSFRQSTFHSKIFGPDRLDRVSNKHIPTRKPVHAIDMFCLSLLDGKLSLGLIADQLTARFPEKFAKPKEALDHVSALVSRYED